VGNSTKEKKELREEDSLDALGEETEDNGVAGKEKDAMEEEVAIIKDGDSVLTEAPGDKKEL